MTEEQARTSTHCDACGEPKQLGLIVCWDCFKYRDNAFKYSTLPFNEWLELVKDTEA